MDSTRMAESTSHVAKALRCFVLAAASLLAACATPVIMLKNDATGVIVTCGGNTIGSMEGRSTEQASDAACVREYQAKGYRITNKATEQLLQQQAQMPAAAPITRTTVPVESRWLLNAETLARQAGCRTPLVTLVERGAGTERLRAECADGSVLAFVCDFDGCRRAP